MSGICKECNGCKHYFGHVVISPITGPTMIYECAETCPDYHAELKARQLAREAEEARAKAEAEAKKKAELEKLYKFFEANAKEPAWFKKEHPAHYAAGWRLLECGNLYGLKCGKETTIGKGFMS